MSSVSGAACTEAEVLKDIGEKLQASLNVSVNRLRKMWHGFGRVLRQQLLECLGERWSGGYISVLGFGQWFAKRRSPESSPVMGFVLAPSHLEQYKLVQHASKHSATTSSNSNREFDVHRMMSLCHVEQDKVETFLKVFFSRICELSGSTMKVALPHVGRLDIQNREVTFRFFSEFLEIVSPSTGMSLEAVPTREPAVRRSAGDARVIESVQKWLSGHPSNPLECKSALSTCTSFSRSSQPSQSQSLKRPSSVVTGSAARTVRTINSTRVARPHSSSSMPQPRKEMTMPVPESLNSSRINLKLNDTTQTHAANVIPRPTPTAAHPHRAASACPAGRAARNTPTTNATLTLKTPTSLGVNVSGTAATLLSSSSPAPMLADVNGANGRARVPKTALNSVMADAYQRHEAFLTQQRADEERHQEYIKQKTKEADEYEKAASRSRRELIKKTSEALGMQVGEKRARKSEILTRPKGIASDTFPMQVWV